MFFKGRTAKVKPSQPGDRQSRSGSGKQDGWSVDVKRLEVDRISKQLWRSHETTCDASFKRCERQVFDVERKCEINDGTRDAVADFHMDNGGLFHQVCQSVEDSGGEKVPAGIIGYIEKLYIAEHRRTKRQPLVCRKPTANATGRSVTWQELYRESPSGKIDFLTFIQFHDGDVVSSRPFILRVEVYDVNRPYIARNVRTASKKLPEVSRRPT